MPLSRSSRALIAFAGILVTIGTLGGAVPVSAQSVPDSSSREAARAAQQALDSLRARLARTETDIALLRDQLATESSSQVRLRSRVRLDLYARLLTSVYRTQAAGNALDLPLFARPSPRALAPSAWISGLQVRQSTFGAAVTVDSVRGAAFSADIDFDLAGATPTDGSPLFPLPRVRTMRASLRWPSTDLMMGLESPLISDLNPYSVASVAVPNFATAGNLWNWIPQVRVTRTLRAWGREQRAVRVAVQAAVLSPFANELASNELGELDAAVRSGRPSLESRVRVQWGLADEEPTAQLVSDRGGEIGVGAHRGWLRLGGDTLISSRALSLDMRMGLTHGLEVRGEAYRGRLLRGLGGGAIGQNFALPRSDGTRGDPLENVAGWIQVNAQLHHTVMVGSGCGIDRVITARAARTRNTSCASHISWRPAVPLLLDLELRQLSTRGANGVLRARHVNLAFGIEL